MWPSVERWYKFLIRHIKMHVNMTSDPSGARSSRHRVGNDCVDLPVELLRMIEEDGERGWGCCWGRLAFILGVLRLGDVGARIVTVVDAKQLARLTVL